MEEASAVGGLFHPSVEGSFNQVAPPFINHQAPGWPVGS